jgi:glc operon protein GlcG
MPNGAPTLAVALRVLALGTERAGELLLRVAIVVVDRGGHDVAVARMDGVGYVNVEVARRKARAANAFGVATHQMSEMLGRDPLLPAALAATDDHLLVLPGGFPLTEITTPVGGFGIAGGHYEQDREIGEHIVRTLAAEL